MVYQIHECLSLYIYIYIYVEYAALSLTRLPTTGEPYIQLGGGHIRKNGGLSDY